MSTLSSPARLAQKHLHLPRLQRERKTGMQSCHWVEPEEHQAVHGRRELAADVKKLLDGLLVDEVSNDDLPAIPFPGCLIAKSPCDLHYEALLEFIRDHSSGTDQVHQAQSQTLDTERHSNGFGVAAYPTPSDSNEKFCDFNDKGPRDVANKVKSECADDGCPADVGADDLEEYDDKEVIRKDEASECHMPIVEVNDHNEKRLKPVFDNVTSAPSVDDSLRCEMTPKCPRTPSSGTRHRSRSSLQTPKDSPSRLQYVHETDSAQKEYFRIRYEMSPSERTLKGYITLSVDPSCYDGVEVNEGKVRRLIMGDYKSKANDPTTAKEGFVYAFRDNDFALIKIGFTTADWNTRKANIERNCGLMTGLTLLAAVKVKAHRRLEEIVHQDLAPHRRFFDCACGKNNKGFTRHQEYFQIDDAAALSTLQLWADFVEEQPWERDQSSEPKTCLRKEWRDKLSKASQVEPDETHGDHDKRVGRWRKLLGIPDPKVAIIAGPTLTADTSVEQKSTAATTNRLLSPVGTPSKPPRVSVGGEVAANGHVKLSSSSMATLEHSSSNNAESFVLTKNEESRSTSRLLTFGQPVSSKEDRSTDNDPVVVEKTTTQARSMPDQQSVESAETNPDPASAFASIAESQPGNSDPSRLFTGFNPTAITGPLHSPKRLVNTLPEEFPLVPGCFADITFNPDFSSSNHNHAAFSTQTGSNIKIEQSTTDELIAAVECDPKSPRRRHGDEQPGPERNPDKVPSPWNAQKPQTASASIIHSPLAQLIFEVATQLLVKEVQPMPSRTISADLWQLRWPLACSVVFALQSPHVPSVLSFLMWSVFLPFFVAELRGWRFVAL